MRFSTPQDPERLYKLCGLQGDLLYLKVWKRVTQVQPLKALSILEDM